MGCGGSKTAAAPKTVAATCPEGDYKVNLERQGDADTLGLTIVGEATGVFLVQGVKEEGLVPAFNKTQENTPEIQVKAGDMIVAVNGVFGDVDAMKTQMQQKTIALTMKRKAAETPAAQAPAAATATAEAAPAAEGAQPASVAEPAAEPAAEPPVATQEAAAAVTEEAAAVPVVAEGEAAAEAPAEPLEVEVYSAPVPPLSSGIPEDQNVPVDAEPAEIVPEGTKCGVCC